MIINHDDQSKFKINLKVEGEREKTKEGWARNVWFPPDSILIYLQCNFTSKFYTKLFFNKLNSS